MAVLHRYFSKWKLRVNINKTVAILFTKRRPSTPPTLQFQHKVFPWSPHIRHLGLELDPKPLFTKHLLSAKHKAIGLFLKLFALLARDSTLSHHNKLTVYKLMIRTVLTYAAHVWSNSSSSDYRHLQRLQSKCLRGIGNYPRRTPIPHLHSALNIEPIQKFIYRYTEKFFHKNSTHPNHLVLQIGNYTLPDLHKQYQYRKYIHNGPNIFCGKLLPSICNVCSYIIIFTVNIMVSLTFTYISTHCVYIY
jgi:predicted metal-binding protein